MTLSIWRYSHLVLAISSSFFLLFIALTGMILSLEPVRKGLYPYHVSGAEDLTLSQVVGTVKKHYEDESIYSIKHDKNGFIILEADSGTFYINPFTGEKIGDLIKRKALFKTMEGLHRSLLLQAPGRIIVGINAVLCLLIVVSGIALIAKRQQGFRGFFKKVTKDHWAQYLHTVLGRWTLVPLLVLTLTGTYLFFQRYGIIPKGKFSFDPPAILDEEVPPTKPIGDFTIFNQTKLTTLRELVFPFEEDVEEFYHLKLKGGELYVNQFTGAVLSEQKYPFVMVVQALSFNLHTGSGSPVWSIILGLSTLAIPYFIYSGFVMTFRRRSGRVKNKFTKDNSAYVILIGSEGGTTFAFAKMLQKALIERGKRCFTTQLNNYTHFKKMEHLIIMTATYGKGEAPSNAQKFEKLLQEVSNGAYTYAVLGCGSMAYPDYCQYAIEVEKMLHKKGEGRQLFPMHKINNQSFESYTAWVNEWSEKQGLTLSIDQSLMNVKRPKTHQYRITSKTNAADNPDDTYLITMACERTQKTRSGDLIAVYPPKETRARLYSIAWVNDEILLSVKRREKGVCSNYMNDMKVGECLIGYRQRNPEFYLPKKRKPVICIATGTGIAPFLGMLHENEKLQAPLYLYWGGKHDASFEIYRPIVNKALKNGALTQYLLAYSRQTKSKVYVTHLIQRDAPMVANVFAQGGTVMICGSINMQKEVFEVLKDASMQYNKRPMLYYQNKGQIRVDCY